MSRGPSYGQLIGMHVELQADMAAWPAKDARRPAAVAELAAMERRMAVLATHALTCPCCSEPDPADVGDEEPREVGTVLYGNFRR